MTRSIASESMICLVKISSGWRMAERLVMLLCSTNASMSGSQMSRSGMGSVIGGDVVFSLFVVSVLHVLSVLLIRMRE